MGHEQNVKIISGFSLVFTDVQVSGNRKPGNLGLMTHKQNGLRRRNESYPMRRDARDD
jgi:hypothetical protein